MDKSMWRTLRVLMAAWMGQEPQPYKPPRRLLQIVGSVAAPVAVSVLWIAWTVH
jgi:hypothetical protein